MAEPKGNLVTPVAFNPSGYPLALEVDANGYLKVVITGAPGSDLLTELQQKLETAQLQLDANGALRVILKSSDITLPVSVAAPASGLVGTHGYVSGAWQKNPIQFGYSSAYAERPSNTNLPVGNSSLDTSAIPNGKICILTNLSYLYVGTTATQLGLGIYRSSVNHNLFTQYSPANNVWYDRQGWWLLKSGDVLRVSIYGATAGDKMYGDYVGYMVDINL
jgi:hypothetical protein